MQDYWDSSSVKYFGGTPAVLDLVCFLGRQRSTDEHEYLAAVKEISTLAIRAEKEQLLRFGDIRIESIQFFHVFDEEAPELLNYLFTGTTMGNITRSSQTEFHQSRRRFLRRAALAGTATVVAQSWTLPITVAKERSPNERLNIGCIGVAARGASNVSGVATENIVALCDIDAKRLDGAAAKYPKADKYRDFRRLLERTDLDAVVVSTPDHIHVMPVLAAIELGLDVYCEKPLAHSVYEVRKIRDTARQHGAATQMGTQIHAPR